MEQRFYKVRLGSGRVIGPVDLERLKLFIFKGKITGLEVARLYPTGDWKDINSYPEVAELLMQKLEGKLTLDAPASAKTDDQNRSTSELPEMSEMKEPSFGDLFDSSAKVESNTHTPGLAIETPDESQSDILPSKTVPNPKPAEAEPEDERTVVITADDEHTMMYTPGDKPKAKDGYEPGNLEIVDADENGMIGRERNVSVKADQQGVEVSVPGSEEIVVNQFIAQEKTAMLTRPKELPQPFWKKQKKVIVALGIAISAAVVLLPDSTPPPDVSQQPFRVEMPSQLASDPQKSEKVFKDALKPYSHDTVEGYKQAARLFLKSASLDPNNTRALCLLASSYMNLIDVLPRDENYFNIVTRLIELARAKGMDLAETVLVDVELYHVLANPDAAINRIIEYSKSHPQFGIEMYYYLALSFYLKGSYSDALKYLNNIDPKNYFSPKINFLYGLIYEKNNQMDDALKSYQETITRSPKHIRAQLKMAELYFHKDNLPESSKHADYVIQNATLASRSELAKAYYFRARMHQVAQRDQDALQDLEVALKNSPDDQDILLDFFTLKAKLGAKVKDAQGKARMFNFLALGEKAFKDGNFHEAMTHYLSARDAQESDSVPLIRLAEVFRRKGDLQSAKQNYAKAVQLTPKMTDIYPKYIKTLVDAYEFEEASKVLNQYKEFNPAVSVVDRLQGDIYYKQEKLEEAHAYYKRALSSTNADSSVYIAYANVMFKGNNFRDSAFYYGLAQRFDPFNIEATIGIGKSLSELESLERGVEYVQNALQISPYKAALLNGIGEIYFRKGDYASALKFAENALTTDPSFALANKTRGDAYAAQEKTKEALDAYLTYTNLAPLDPSGHIERYKIYLKKLDLKASKEAIQKVIDSYPKYPGVYYMLGQLYWEASNFDSSMKASMEEIKNNPGYLPAYVLAASSLTKAGDNVNALQMANKALKLNPNNVAALIQAGIANHNLKTYAAAQSMFERALTLDSGNPEGHKRLGALFHDLGDLEKSKQHFRAYLDLYPSAPDKAEIEQLTH